MFAYEVIKPSYQTPFIASIPHSGMLIPYNAAKYFTPEHCASLINTDWYIDRLYDFLPSLGVTVLKNNIYKYVIDVNREAVDPLFGNYWKCAVPDAIPEGVPIWWQLYTEIPSETEIKDRVKRFHTPYHDALKRVIEDLKREFNTVYLFDLHSYVGGLDEDICLGNCKGVTCPEDFIDWIFNKLSHSGFDVVKNLKYTGGYITKRYFDSDSVITLQVEVKSGSFIDPIELDQGRPPRLNTEKMNPLKQAMKALFTELTNTGEF